MRTPQRIYQDELLDAGAGNDQDVARNLKDIRRVNRWLGGTRVVIEALSAAIGRTTDSFSLLDVGTGSADIPGAVFKWCQRRGIQSSIAAVDVSARNLKVARNRLGVSPAVELVQADSLALPFGERSFDFVVASMFLHHFKDEDVVKLLESFAIVARRAVIVNDLLRDLVPYYLTQTIGRLLATSFLTRNDAPVSVLRGFTADELSRLAANAGLDRVTVQRVFPYRLMLVANL